jgi:hypothetical protein
MADAIKLARTWLEQMPEIDVLSDIARSIGEPIRIRGGVPRNLLGRAIRAERDDAVGPAHLIDLVDPLSDIDIVVSNAEMVATALGHIFSRLALAGFTRWEGKTSAQVANFNKHGASTHLDGVEIKLSARGFQLIRAQAAVRDLQDRTLRGKVPKGWAQDSDVHAIDAALFALRIARFAAQFGLDVDDKLKKDVSRLQRKEGHCSRLDLLRLDLAALDIFLTAPTPSDAKPLLHWLREIVPRWVRDRSRALLQLEDVFSSTGPSRVIAYPRMGGQPPRVRFEVDVHENSVLRDEPTLIPWTPIRLPPFAVGACCPPVDFALGPLVIAWRGVDLSNERVGVVALAPSADPYEPNSRFVFGVPGVITRQTAVVQRLDWGFARYLAGDGRLVYIGAREAIGQRAAS